MSAAAAPPAPSRSIPLLIPSIEEEDIAAMAAVVRSGNLVQGEKVAALEEAVRQVTGSAHAVAASNGTATLHLSLAALGIGPGDEVIVPAFSFIATANAVVHAGARPVFVDICRSTFNIDPALVEAAITPRTRAIMVVHEFGLMADMEPLLALAGRHRLPLIEDAACALGATQGGLPAGRGGVAGSFSLHPRKTITSGEGGVLVTEDPELAEQYRILRNHGISQRDGRMEFVAPGYNYRMTDFQAALALSQLRRLPDMLAVRRQLAANYLARISHPCLVLPAAREGHAWQTFHLMVEPPLSQEEVITRLRAAGIGCNLGAQCLPAQDFYARTHRHQVREFPQAWAAWQQGVAIPLHPRLSPADQDHIIQTLNSLPIPPRS